MSKSIFFSVSLFVLLVGCASKDFLPNGNPRWTLNLPASDTKIYGAGESGLSSPSRAKQQAITQARAQIAGQVSVSIKNAVTDSFKQAGTAESAVSYYEQVTKEVSDETLNGTLIEEVFYNEEEKRYYALVSLPKKNILKKSKQSLSKNQSGDVDVDGVLQNLEKELDN